MKTIKYPIKEVNIAEIPNNKVLGVGVSQNQKALCRKTIESYGLLTPIVAVEKAGGSLMVLKGDNELTVLKDMSVDKADVFIAAMKNDDDIGKVILLLSSLQKETNHISEGLILKEVIGTGKYDQKRLAVQLAKSEAWISKRLYLVERLDESVTAMVLEKELSSSVAQNVARIPKNLQHEFALNIRLSNIPKVEVEKLVRMYFAYNTSDSLRNTIIGNPSLASALIGVTVETEKISIKSDAMEKFEGVLRLLLKLITEIEAFFAKLGQDQILKYSDLIHTVKSSAAGLIALIGSVSPGKPEKITGERIGGTDDNG